MKTFGKVWLGIGLLAIAFGIGILVLNIGIGASRSNIPTYSMDESFNDIESIDIQIAFGEVIIKEGDEFHIEADNVLDDEFKAYVSDGTWIIEDASDNIMDLFGMRFSVNQLFWWKDDLRPEFTITIPKDFVAKDFSLLLSAGTADVDAIRADQGSFEVKAGTLKINELDISESSEYNVGTGEMIIKQINANNIAVEGGVGSINMDGIITGDSSVNCGIGAVYLNISGNVEEYSFDIESGIGNIKINEKSYHLVNERKIKTEGAIHTLKLENGIGDITVVIK